jgi:hypothetical protein
VVGAPGITQVEVLSVFVSRFMPCDRCGESVDLSRAVPHECAPDRVLDFQLFALRAEIAGLEGRFRHYLRTPHGRFETWLAARQVRRGR